MPISEHREGSDRRDTTVGPYSQMKLSVRTLTQEHRCSFQKLGLKSFKISCLKYCLTSSGRDSSDWNSQILSLLNSLFPYLEIQYLADIFISLFVYIMAILKSV